jgi:hypothetical protein
MNYFDQVSEQARRRRPQIGFGLYEDAEPTLDQAPLTEEERESLLSQVGGLTGQATSLLLDALDKPGQGLRYMLSGKTDPGEMLQEFGLRPGEDDGWGLARPVADFAAGLLTDPLTYIGTGTVSAAGKAAKAAGLLDDAARAASSRAIRSGNVGGRYAENSLDFYRSLGRGAGSADPLTIARDISPFELASRPLVGPRTSRRGMTLRELIAEQGDEAGSAMQKVQNQFAPGKNIDSLLDSTLSKDIGFGLPLSDYTPIGVNLPVGEAFASTLDTLGQGLRYSAAGRLGHKLFNRNVGNTYEAADQHLNDAFNRTINTSQIQARERLHDQISHMAEDLGDPQASEAVRSVIETGGSEAERALVAANPRLQEFVDNAPEWLKNELDRRIRTGLPGMSLVDENGTKYFPRQTSNFSFQEFIDQNSRETGGGLVASVAGEAKKRGDYLKTPGGTKVLNELSRNPDLVRQPGQTAEDMLPRKQRARIIRDRLNQEYGNPETFPGFMTPGDGSHMPKQVWGGTGPIESFDANQANSIANLLENIDPNSTQTGTPLFGRNVLDDYTDYMLGSDKAIRSSEFLQDMMSRSTRISPLTSSSGRTTYRAATDLPGRQVSVPQALQELGQRSNLDPDTPATLLPELRPDTVNPATGLPFDPAHDFATAGAKDRILGLLRERFPGHIDEIDQLNRASLDRSQLQRLANIGRFESSGAAKQGAMKIWDDVTRIWRSSLLSWPAKYTRDWYGGKFVNYVQTGGKHMVDGSHATKALIQGDLPTLDIYLQKIRKYADLGTTEERVNAFRRDMFSNKAMEATRNMDFQSLGNDIQGAGSTIEQMLPGRTQGTTVGYQAWDAMTGKGMMPMSAMPENELLNPQSWRNFNQLGMNDPRNVQNPILRWGAAVGDTTEKINRMEGTLALMMQGWDVGEAVRVMRNAHTDPSSLTKIEREFMRRAFPFWSFTSRIGKWVAQNIWERPGGRFTQAGLRLPNELFSSGEDEYVPESIKANYGFRASDEEDQGFGSRLFSGVPFGSVKPGVTPWVTDIDLPGIDTINLIRPSYEPDGSLSYLGTAGKTLEDFVGRNAAPGVKGIVERLTGVDSYTKRPLKESTSAPQQLLEKISFGAIRPESAIGQAVGIAKPAIDTIPFAARLFQSTNRLLDTERVDNLADRAFQLGVNATAGIKIQNLDDDVKRVDARKKIADILGDDPFVKSFSQVYVPEELRPYADPVTMRMLALDRQLGRELQRERAIRRGEPVKAKRRKVPDPVSAFD